VRENYLPYFRPSIEPDDISAVADSMRNGWLTTGPMVQQFEDEFAKASGAKHAIALNSCTSGLQLGLISLGVSGGDEVVMPSLTFVAGSQCVCQFGATPGFCDIYPETFCVLVEKLEKVITERTKVLNPMQFGGSTGGIGKIVQFDSADG